MLRGQLEGWSRSGVRPVRLRGTKQAEMQGKYGMDDLDVAAMLCSLMCHDLVSPIGALVNGVEILEEEEDKKIQEQALGLLSHSAEEASRRLQFFRLAFGASGGLGTQINVEEARRVLDGLFENEKVVLVWKAPACALEKTIIKLLLNMVFTGAEGLGRGGTVEVDVGVNEAGDSSEVSIYLEIKGQNAGLRENTESLLTGEADPDDLTTRTVQPYYTWCLAEMIGAKIKVDDGAEHHISMSTIVPSSD